MTREELYELVWSKPMTEVAKDLDVSGSYMARVCTVLNVPRPERGYWAKLTVGKAPAREPLPEAQPGDQLHWSKDGKLHPPPQPRVQIRRRRTPAPPPPADSIHPLVRGARQHFETGRPVEEGAHLKPYKRLLLDVTTSKTCLDKALTFANDLYAALQSAGHRIVMAPSGQGFYRSRIDEREERREQRNYYHNSLWSPDRPTLVYVGTVAIGLAIVEMSEQTIMRYIGNGRYIRDADYIPPKASRHFTDHTWTTTRENPSGRLRLVAYSPYSRVTWTTDWQETKSAPLDKSHHDASDNMPVVSTHSGLPTILQRMLPNPRRPLSAETVRRILSQVVARQQHYTSRPIFDVQQPQIISWGTLEDGTTVAIVEDSYSRIRHMWSLDRVTFRPVSYGMVDA